MFRRSPPTPAQAAFQGAQLSQQRVTSYVELVSTPRVSEEVIRQLNLNTTPDELGKHITATSKPDSVIIDVAVTGESPQTRHECRQRHRHDLSTAGRRVGAAVVSNWHAARSGSRGAASRRAGQAVIDAGLPVTLALGLLVGARHRRRRGHDPQCHSILYQEPGPTTRGANAPNLGNIAFDANVPKRPLTVHEDPQSPRSEAFPTASDELAVSRRRRPA